jgi:hypothetical protein
MNLQTNYRQFPAISNSDLTEFRDFIFGYNRFKPVNAFAFGSALHEVLLEPKIPHIFPDTVDIDLITVLKEKVKDNKFCKWILQFSRKEQSLLFQDNETLLPCKAKIDMVFKQNIIVDFKTTSQRTEEAFLKSCFEYDYDRQSAFYLDAVINQQKFLTIKRNPPRFIFVGIQKKSPHKLFIFDATAEPNFIQQGRNKYQALLGKWQEMGGIPKGFIASSWDKDLLKQAA